ncbi:MAG TPA: YMGG-like glycine zipper-containing protein [Burkholderiales bacterium]|nr:YMGG-like glycine zipper-containing protein [Burkholderiales bacterium]
MTHPLRWSALAATLLLGACASVPPSGPSVMVLPGSGKTFDQFRMDDYTCRQFASSQIGGATAEQASTNSGLKSAAIGAGVGAVAGALLGGHEGAGQGAAAGLVVGSVAGAGTAESSSYTLQQRYDIAYQQCMYAKGNQVPIAGRFAPRRSPAYAPPPPPPPPPGDDR